MIENKDLFVASVTSNIKGQERSVDLSRRTLLLGPNGSGKSAVVNAVELALTGTVSDIAGRASVTKTADLLSLAPGRKGTLYSNVELSDGSILSWKAEGSEGRAKAPERTSTHPFGFWEATILPLRDVREALLGSPDTARRFILTYAVPGQSIAECDTGMTDAEIAKLFPADLRERYEGLAAACEYVNPIERLLSIQKQCGSEKRRCGTETKGAEKLAGQLGEGDTMPPSEAELAAARERVEEAAQNYTLGVAAAHNAGSAQQRERLGQEIADLYAKKKELEAYAGTIPPVPELERKAQDEHRKVKLALSELLAFQATIGADDCLVCGTEVGIERLRMRHAEVTSRLQASINAEVAHVEAERKAQEVAQLHLRAQARIDQIAYEITDRVKAAGELPEDDGSEADTEALHTLNMAAIHAREALSDMQTKHAIWERVQRARDQVRELEGESIAWKALEKECGKVVRGLVDKSLAAFIEKVQGFLPASDEFCIQMRDGSRDVFRIGLVHDGELHTALSGAEWARVTAAVAGACIPEGAPLAVVIPEDRAWDGATLAATMRAFSKLPAQVIIASTTKPKGKAPKGWTVVETDNIREAAPATDEATPESATNGTPPLNIADFLA